MDLSPTSITAWMVGLNSRIAVFNYQRKVNEYQDEALTAILPGVVLQELWLLVGSAENALLTISIMVVLAGLIGMLTQYWHHSTKDDVRWLFCAQLALAQGMSFC